LMSQTTLKNFVSQDEDIEDSQNFTQRSVDSSEDSNNKSLSKDSQNNDNQKRKRTKKAVGRPEDSVINEFIKLGIRDKYGHVAIKYKYCNEITSRERPISNMAKLHTYYVTNAHHELNYVGQNISENDFLKLMQDYSYSLSSDTALFEEDIHIHLEYASNNTNQLVISEEIIDHGEKDFNIDLLINQGTEIRNRLLNIITEN
ncbi:846_t:CDS:2, partial [Scutellospora calospora]